ncbi:hypothetical protein [Bacillus sp. MMSF_3328]|uniref:hypothetical protein n=1 Tax=Bacillus sp. MMSF_3328 TaxID=3047080 RepID=UPI00273FA5FE|nr:hypothetical protein [Bacillus sp. MMSF_3328]
MKRSETFFTSIFPAAVTILSFFLPGLTYPIKVIVPLAFGTLYFVIVSIVLQHKVKIAQLESSALNCQIDKLKDEKTILNGKLESYSAFTHKRELFIKHDLTELSELLTEYEGYVKNTYRSQKQKELREEAGTVKKRALQIINNEKRSFDEQLYNVQSD